MVLMAIELTCSTFQPRSGGMEMSPERTHTVEIMRKTRTGVRCVRYSTALAMDKVGSGRSS